METFIRILQNIENSCHKRLVRVDAERSNSKMRRNGMRPVSIASNLSKRENTQTIALQTAQTTAPLPCVSYTSLCRIPKILQALPIKEETASLIPIALAGLASPRPHIPIHEQGNFDRSISPLAQQITTFGRISRR